MFGIHSTSRRGAHDNAQNASPQNGIHVQLAHVGIHVPHHARVLLSVFVKGIEMTGETDLILRLYREEYALGAFRCGAACGATGAARWLVEQSAFSAIDIFPPGGPCIYRLSAEIAQGAATFDDAQLWPSLLT